MESKKSNIIQIVNRPDSSVGPTDKAVAVPVTSPAWVPDFVKDQITVIPAERVAVHRVDLPVRAARHRKAALPFALEDALGSTLEDAHITVLDTDRTGSILAGVAAKTWFADLMANVPAKPIVPEQMLLAVPDEYAKHTQWRVHCANDRALVRSSDGTGFACAAEMLLYLWQRSKKPRVVFSGDPLPAEMRAEQVALCELNPKALARFDMRQGAFRPALGLEKPLKWLAASVALAVIGHLGLAMADLRAQAAIAEMLRKEAATALSERLPGASVDDAPALLQRRIAALSAPDRGSGFLPVMQDVSQAWLRDGTPVQLRELAWSADALRLNVESPNLDALQRAEAILSSAGLSISSGSATADAGSARADFTVRP